MKESFLKITDHNDLAAFFGLSYNELTKILYKTGDRYKYLEFTIPKKSGGHRSIKSPRKKIKDLQKKLSEVLYKIYPGRPAAHGFIKGKNILSNSEKHLDKTYIFNIDLSDYFGSIHFGRVRNLFKVHPCKFNHSVSTILAQICCFDNCLPQGAPTSPILSNMVAWKLDAQLQNLAKITNSTYTRYADDITFSFNCSRRRLPEDIVILHDGEASPGHVLSRIIKENGFEINYEKVRLAGTTQRMAVTGVTVNKFPNVPRKYVRQISSILHSWRKYGYEATEKEFNEKYSKRHRASDKPKLLKYVVKGKLSFLRSIRGGRDEIFNKFAKQYNGLVDDDVLKFKIFEENEPESNAINALWVIETCYDDSNGEAKVAQGTGFLLKDYGLITCAHVVSDKEGIFHNIEAFKYAVTSNKYQVQVLYLDKHRDIAICQITSTGGKDIPSEAIQLSDKVIAPGLEARLLGFPAYKDGQSYYIVDTKVASTFPRHGVEKFEIDAQIREGNSGGPIIDVSGKLLGVALEGARKDEGNNAALHYSELVHVKIDKYQV